MHVAVAHETAFVGWNVYCDDVCVDAFMNNGMEDATVYRCEACIDHSNYPLVANVVAQVVRSILLLYNSILMLNAQTDVWVE